MFYFIPGGGLSVPENNKNNDKTRKAENHFTDYGQTSSYIILTLCLIIVAAMPFGLKIKRTIL